MGDPSTTQDVRLGRVVEAIPRWRAASHLTFTPLEGGITNHNYLADVDGERFVVRLAGMDTELLGIDREAERAAAVAAHSVGIGPEVIEFLPELGCLVTRFIEAEHIPPERMSEAGMLELVAGVLRAFHGGPVLPSTFSPFRVVEVYQEEAARHGVSIPPAYDELREAANDIETTFGRDPLAPRPCHNDLLNANFLLQGSTLYVVDYEYAGMGDPFFDLGNFSVNHAFDDDGDTRLLEYYFGQAEPQAIARLKLMRVMSDFREATWGVLQQGISTLDFDYVEYAGKHFDRCLAAISDDRYLPWLEEAGGPAATP